MIRALVAAALTIVAFAGSPAQAAQAPGTYQKTVTKQCNGLCSFVFPATTAGRILAVDYVSCSFAAASDGGGVMGLALTSDKNDGTIYPVPQYVGTTAGMRSYQVSERVVFQLTGGAKPTASVLIFGPNYGLGQTCTISGHYL